VIPQARSSSRDRDRDMVNSSMNTTSTSTASRPQSALRGSSHSGGHSSTSRGPIIPHAQTNARGQPGRGQGRGQGGPSRTNAHTHTHTPPADEIQRQLLAKAQELEDEISTYKHENAGLRQMRKQQELALQETLQQKAEVGGRVSKLCGIITD
jgi:hypothetical protein